VNAGERNSNNSHQGSGRQAPLRQGSDLGRSFIVRDLKVFYAADLEKAVPTGKRRNRDGMINAV
jgi:hypothetical protein